LFSDSFKQLPDFFYLVAFGLFAWVRAMAAPLLALDGYFDARAFLLAPRIGNLWLRVCHE
jgi:Ni,Fe-hydrogenase I cytochrome b subunit